MLSRLMIPVAVLISLAVLPSSTDDRIPSPVMEPSRTGTDETQEQAPPDAVYSIGKNEKRVDGEPTTNIRVMQPLHLIVRIDAGTRIGPAFPGFDLTVLGLDLPGRVKIINDEEQLLVDVHKENGAATMRLPLLEPGVARVVTETGEPLFEMSVPIAFPWVDRTVDGRGDADIKIAATDLPLAMSRMVSLARKSIDCAISDFDSPTFVDALIRAHEHGVRVRLVTDHRTHHDEMAARERLSAAGIAWSEDPRARSPETDDQLAEDAPGPTTGMMHHKSMIIDGRMVWTGHAKPQVANSLANQCAVTILSRQVAAAYLGEFETLWGGSGDSSNKDAARAGAAKPLHPPFTGTIGGAEVEVWFQPSSRGPDGEQLVDRILELIRSSRHEVAFLCSGVGAATIEELRLAKERGVEVVGVFGRPEWRTDAAWGAIGVGPLAWDHPVAIGKPAEWSQPGVEAHVHNRVMVVDRAWVALTSSAWIRNTENDENLIILHDPVLARQFLSHITATLHRSGVNWAPDDFLIARAGPRFATEDVSRIFGGVTEVDAHGDVAALIGGWADHWAEPIASYTLPQRFARRLASSAHPTITMADLFDLGIGLVRSGDRVIAYSAEGRTVRVEDFPESLRESLVESESIPAGLVLGRYEEVAPLGADQVTDAIDAPFVIDERGLPLLSAGGLGRISSIWERTLTPIYSAMKGERLYRAKKLLEGDDGPHYATLETLSALAGMLVAVKSSLGVEFLVAELSCPMGGYPDYDGNGLTDDPNNHLFGESVRIYCKRSLTEAEAHRLLALATVDFSTVALDFSLFDVDVDPRRLFTPTDQWSIIKDDVNRLQAYHHRGRTSVIIDRNGGKHGLRLRLRTR